jgi:hypothetical protein
MRVSAELYTAGDHYPIVRSWMVKLDAVERDIRANAISVTEADARVYVALFLGPKFDLRFRRMSSSAGVGWHKWITLDPRGLTLGTVLHEIAHAIQHGRQAERIKVRRAKLDTRQMLNYSRKELRAQHCGHGEAFCRTYARLLREVLS